jgi:hypothetical protein
MEDNPMEDSLINWLNTFEELLTAPITCISELADGVILHRILQDISPSHFAPVDLVENCGSNAVMKTTNIRRLLRALEGYYREVLVQAIDSDFVDPATVAKADPPEVAKLVELVLGCAVQVSRCKMKVSYLLLSRCGVLRIAM